MTRTSGVVALSAFFGLLIRLPLIALATRSQLWMFIEGFYRVLVPWCSAAAKWCCPCCRQPSSRQERSRKPLRKKSGPVQQGFAVIQIASKMLACSSVPAHLKSPIRSAERDSEAIEVGATPSALLIATRSTDSRPVLSASARRACKYVRCASSAGSWSVRPCE